VALRAGCHLCNLIEENRSYEERSNDEFPYKIKYAFIALSEEWTRHGHGSKWMIPQIQDADDFTELATYLDVVEKDPTSSNTGHLLATDLDELINNPSDFWLVLELCGPRTLLALPLEFAALGTCPLTKLLPLLTRLEHVPEAEQITQIDLGGQKSSGSKENLQLASAWLYNCKRMAT
jgi:hypothetical protein